MPLSVLHFTDAVIVLCSALTVFHTEQFLFSTFIVNQTLATFWLLMSRRTVMSVILSKEPVEC